jgi:hypothetical protein
VDARANDPTGVSGMLSRKKGFAMSGSVVEAAVIEVVFGPGDHLGSEHDRETAERQD